MKRQNGFSMTELMVVVAIVAILLGIGVPSFRYVTNANRASAEVNGLLGDLMYARAEAIRQGTKVIVCTSANSQSCAAGVNTWEGGWITCVANNPTPAGTCDGTTVVLRVQKPFTSTDTLRPDGVSNATAVAFGRVGFATGMNAAGSTFTLRAASDTNSVWTRCLSVTPIGMLTTTNHVKTPGCV